MVLSFPLFKQQNGLTQTTVDLHSHLIPGIDDGAKDLERSVELVLSLQEMGYSKLITTPHISDMFPNSSQSILEGYENLKNELNKRHIEMDIEVAAEYYADETFEELLKKKDILTFGGDNNYLLFELSYFTEPQDLETLVQEIQLAGYTPVLAHPERYIYFHDSIDAYIRLKNMGILLQINLNSIVDYYSEEIGKVAKQLIANGLVDFVGSDAHHRRHTKFLKKSFSHKYYHKIFKNNNILNDTLM